MECDEDTVKIKFSSKLNRKAPVFLSDFSCGRLNNDKITFECFKAENDSLKNDHTAKRILTAQGCHLRHSGKSQATEETSVRYFLGVRNNGKLKLYDSKFFHLKPELQNKLLNNESAPLTVSGADYWEKRNQLTAAFGGKISKRNLNTKMKLSVDVDDNVFEEELRDSLLTRSIIESPGKSSEGYLPTINRNAQSVDEVFNLSNIIEPEEEVALEETTKDWLEQYNIDPDVATEGICKFINKFLPDALQDHNKLKLLFYLEYMYRLQHLRSIDIRKKEWDEDIPQPFKNCLLEKFTKCSKSETGRETRSFSPQMKDKLLAHMLVVALHISNYIVDISLFMSGLKTVSPRHFSTVAQSIGCHIVNETTDNGSTKYAVLKLPLNVIRPRFGKVQF